MKKQTDTAEQTLAALRYELHTAQQLACIDRELRSTQAKIQKAKTKAQRDRLRAYVQELLQRRLEIEPSTGALQFMPEHAGGRAPRG